MKGVGRLPMTGPDVVDPGVLADLGFALQLALGGMFGLSAASKLRRPADFAAIVDGYQLVPTRATPWVAGAVILAESFVAVSCLAGWQVLVGAITVLALVLVFAIGTTINLRRGRAIDCGCFAEAEEISPRTLQRLGIIASGGALLSAGLVSEEVSRESLANSVDQGLLNGGAYLIATAGISAFLILAARLALESRSILRRQGGS